MLDRLILEGIVVLIVLTIHTRLVLARPTRALLFLLIWQLYNIANTFSRDGTYERIFPGHNMKLIDQQPKRKRKDPDLNVVRMPVYAVWPRCGTGDLQVNQPTSSSLFVGAGKGAPLASCVGGYTETRFPKQI